jgi:cold shock CspA family protein/predicted RNA-binding Zn-ribbon protein involved in translation (DUF1610 family)
MQGKIKWFSKEKGYGYVVADDGKDFYFNVRDLKGTDLPGNGDIVSFQIGQGPKGPKATSISIIAKAQINANQNGARNPKNTDDRVTCPHCGKKMVPRIITNRGEVSKSVCPFCGGTFKDFGWCFIATAVYGDYEAPEVIALRRFRDEALQPSLLGQWFISIYYGLSPPIARFISKKPFILMIIKPFLNILAKRYIKLKDPVSQ